MASMKKLDEKTFDNALAAFDAGYDLTYRYHISRHWYGEHFIYPAEAQIIQAVGKNPGTTSVRLSRDNPKSRSAYSQIIRKMEKKGYIEQTINRENRREQLLHLTASGEELFTAHTQVERFYLNRTLDMLRDFSEEDVLTYIRVQERLNQSFELDVIDGERAIEEHQKDGKNT